MNKDVEKAVGVHKEMGEFLIGNLFELHKGKRLTKADQTKGTTLFIGSSANNNGVTDYIGQEPIFTANAITVSYNGSVGQVFYQEQPFWASDDINVLYLKGHTLNIRLFGYLGACLTKAGKQFSYSFKWHLERMRDTTILLPIQTDSTGQPILDKSKGYHPDGYIPDWDFMEKYIVELEQERIAELEQYLVATGLNDYELTDEDMDILSLSLVRGVTKNQIVRLLLGFAKK